MSKTTKLVILAGSPRGGIKTWKSIYKNLVDENTDLAICTGDSLQNNFTLKKNISYWWIFKEYENWDKYYIENNYEEALNFLKKGLDTGLYSSGKIHFAIKDIILKNYIETIKSYDYIYYLRFDQFIISKPNANNYKGLTIPEGEDYFGICDRFIGFERKYAHNFFNILDFVNKNPELSVKHLNCETVFLEHLKYEKINNEVVRTPRVQFTTALNSDKTNWRIPIYRLHGYRNLMIKYPDEFLLTCSNYLQKKGFKSFIKDYVILCLNFYYLLLREYLGKLKRTID